MHTKISWEALMPGLSPTLVAGLIQFTRALNSVTSSFDLFIAWPFSWVLYTQHDTCIDKDEC